MFFRKKQEELQCAAGTVKVHVEKLIKEHGVDAVIVDNDPQDVKFMTRSLRRSGINCVGVSNEDDVYRVIELCNPKIIILDFRGSERIAERVAIDYPDRSVICSGMVFSALDDLAAKVKRVFSKDNLDPLVAYIKTGT